MSAPSRESGSGTAAALAAGAVVLLALGFVAAYVWVATHRLTYPFDLEWMEGACADHVARVMQGQPLYARPTLTFIPFFYPPLYYYVSAAAAAVLGLSLFTLRLVSFLCSIGVLALMVRWIQKETASARAGVLGAGLFAATYAVGGAWLDLARVDALFLLLTVLGAFWLRFGSSRRAAVAAGVILALATLTKQTAGLIAAPLLVWSVFEHRRRAALAIAAFAAVLGGATVALDAATHGWYLQYVLVLPGRIQALGDVPAAIWQRHIAGPLAILVAIDLVYAGALAVRSPRRAAFVAILLAAFVGGAWASGRHSGAYVNTYIPAHLALALVAGFAAGEAFRRTGAAAARLQLAICALCALQFLMLRYDPAALIPTARDRDAAQTLRSALPGLPGGVLAPQHGLLATAAGKPMTAHAWAVFDLLRVADPGDARALDYEIHARLASGAFHTVILDKPEPWLEPELSRYYRCDPAAAAGDALWTRTGYHTHPRWVCVRR